MIEDPAVRYCDVWDTSDRHSVNTKVNFQEIHFAFNCIFKSVSEDSPLKRKGTY